MAVDSLAKQKTIIVYVNRSQCNREKNCIAIEEARKMNIQIFYTFIYTLITL